MISTFKVSNYCIPGHIRSTRISILFIALFPKALSQSTFGEATKNLNQL